MTDEEEVEGLRCDEGIHALFDKYVTLDQRSQHASKEAERYHALWQAARKVEHETIAAAADVQDEIVVYVRSYKGEE